uniref:G-protein coupled receptors family 3 profile domain-containing protein n=1 Tax=Naja naja TaxID=35670 RepID=A0A8C6VHG0_NAJNA
KKLLQLLYFALEVPYKRDVSEALLKAAHGCFKASPGSVLFLSNLVSKLYKCIFYLFSFWELTFFLSKNKKFPKHFFEIILTSLLFIVYALIPNLAFAVNEINQNPQMLPNVSLGFHIYDSYYNEKMSYRTTLDLLFKFHSFVPNYVCNIQKKLMAIIEMFLKYICLSFQLTYGSFASEQKNLTLFPSFYRMVSNEAHQYTGLVQLLKHFGWIWIGLIVLRDESGDYFLQSLEPLFFQNGICSAFIQRIPSQGRLLSFPEISEFSSSIYKSFMDYKTKIFVVYGETLTVMWLSTLMFQSPSSYSGNISVGRLWIVTAQIDFTVMGLVTSWDSEFFQGTISFEVPSNEPLGFQTYLQKLKCCSTHDDYFLKDFWEQAFHCKFSNSNGSVGHNKLCTGKEKLEMLPGSVFEMQMTGHSYSIFNAVCVLAHALHAMTSFRSHNQASEKRKRQAYQDLQPWQLHRFLQGISFNNSAGESVTFSDRLEVTTGLDIMKMVIFPNNSFTKIKVGRIDSNKEQTFHFYQDKKSWHRHFNQVLPFSLCSDPCQPGYQKKKKEGEKFCCYDCVPCPEGKISCEIAFVLRTFVKHQDTPIVKANNRELTFTLLLSLLLCFLSALLFFGQPNKTTCFLCQTAFGIIFTVAISCVLAKTITVVVAFMATKPGSNMRKWLGRKLASSIVISCTLVQASICSWWMATSPPFPNLDVHSLTSEIIAEYNVGSSVMFYLVLGYLGFLAIISFMVAFFARKLPDAFNEAKFITFSMLMFCSVWLTFVPTYLSTKGKYMVAVEIFSILASSGGLLSCIFFPKCYIILLTPQLNNKQQLRKNN